MPAIYPELRRLRHFISVAEAGGFSRAAVTLHLSQQALSSSIQQLEKDLGTALFHRTGRQVTLTKAGEALLSEGRVLLAAARTVANHVAEVGASATEAFTVAHTPALSGIEAYGVLEPAIDAFPETSFTLRQLYPTDLTSAVLDGSVQLGLRRGVSPPDDLAAAVVGYHPVRLTDAASCTSCALCARICPDVIFEVFARPKGGSA